MIQSTQSEQLVEVSTLLCIFKPSADIESAIANIRIEPPNRSASVS